MSILGVGVATLADFGEYGWWSLRGTIIIILYMYDVQEYMMRTLSKVKKVMTLKYRKICVGPISLNHVQRASIC